MPNYDIDTYYDITCELCRKSRSTDYDMGMWSLSLETFKQTLLREGWEVNRRMRMRAICPECAQQVST